MSAPKGKLAGARLDGAVSRMQRQKESKLPRVVRFPLVVLLSLTLSSMLYSFTSSLTAVDLAKVSRSLDRWWEVGALLGWKTAELAVGWFGDYDGYDLASLSLLAHGPPLYLLLSFYEVSASTVIVSLAIDVATTYIPFRLLRPLSLAHSASSSSTKQVNVPNKEILTSTSIQVYTTVLAAGVYALTLYTAYVSYLPVYLVSYFDGIPSIAAAHSASLISLFPTTLLLGLAAKSFIFTPATGVTTSLAEAKESAFNPATAGIREHLRYNVWGFDKRTKVVVKRTLTLMAVVGINTFVQTAVTVEGVEGRGALGYSAVWVVASGVVGAVLGVVGAV